MSFLSCSCSAGSLRIGCRPRGVAQGVERENRRGDCETRRKSKPGRLIQELATLVEHGAPGGCGRTAAEAEKAECRLEEHRTAENDCRLNQQRRQDVWQDVACYQAQVGRTERASSDDVLFAAFHKYGGPCHPPQGGHIDKSYPDHHVVPARGPDPDRTDAK